MLQDRRWVLVLWSRSSLGSVLNPKPGSTENWSSKMGTEGKSRHSHKPQELLILCLLRYVTNSHITDLSQKVNSSFACLHCAILDDKTFRKRDGSIIYTKNETLRNSKGQLFQPLSPKKIIWAQCLIQLVILCKQTVWPLDEPKVVTKWRQTKCRKQFPLSHQNVSSGKRSVTDFNKSPKIYPKKCNANTINWPFLGLVSRTWVPLYKHRQFHPDC